MAVYSSDLAGILPGQTLDGIVEGTKTASTIAALSGQDPMKFGNVNIVTFDDDPAAEFVDEGGAKSSEDIAPSVAVATPRKAVVTYRTSDEFMWANEDYQLGILDKFAEKAARALGRALDLGAYFRINPKTGNELVSWTNYVNATTNRVEIGADADAELLIEAAAGLLVPMGVNASGIALSPQLAWDLATVRYADGRKKFPEVGYTIEPTSFAGMQSSTSTTVSGKPRDRDAADNGVRAIVGDFNAGLRWGIQREIPFKVIPYGDPDNSGRDLQGHNEVALRAEVVYAWHANVDSFAVIENEQAAG